LLMSHHNRVKLSATCLLPQQPSGTGGPATRAVRQRTAGDDLNHRGTQVCAYSRNLAGKDALA
jgi:hypothetical protein